MELLRRALLLGCLLPGLWLLRLAPLDPLLSVVPIDFAAQQRLEAEEPVNQKTEDGRRRAELPLSVYIEEFVQYNVYSTTGDEWSRLLEGIERAAQPDIAKPPDEFRGRLGTVITVAGTGVQARPVFFRPEDEPFPAVLDQVAAAHGTTYLSHSRPGGDHHYRVVRHIWTRRDFTVGHGFAGTPAPPASLLYPFRWVAVGSVLAGVVLFLLLPAVARPSGKAGGAAIEWLGFAVAVAAFVAPLVTVGGSVQALTRAPWLTIACWTIAAAGMHVFARPARYAPDPIAPNFQPDAPVHAVSRALFLREGAAFLGLALGPLVFVVAISLVLWNR